MIEHLGYGLAAIVAALLILNIVARQRTIERALREHTAAFGFIAEGRADANIHAFASAIMVGDPHGMIPLHWPDFETYRLNLRQEQERGL